MQSGIDSNAQTTVLQPLLISGDAAAQNDRVDLIFHSLHRKESTQKTTKPLIVLNGYKTVFDFFKYFFKNNVLDKVLLSAVEHRL